MDERRLTFGEHLEELRYRLVILLLAVLIAFILCWVFRIPLMNILAAPHQRTMRALGFSEDLKVTSYQEAFITMMKVCFVAALFLASPVVIYEIWMFIAAGLYHHEKKYVHIFAPICMGSFLLGMLFGYFILIPFGLRFLLLIVGNVATPIIKISDYVALLMLLTLVLGIVFQLPLVLLFLVKIDLITAATLRKERRYAILIAFILAAILTPPDPGTQIMLAIPIIALYEIGILIAAPSRSHFLKFCGCVLGGAAAIGILLLYVHAKSQRAGELTEGRLALANPGDAARQGTPVDIRKGGTIKVGSLFKTDSTGGASFRLACGAELRMNTNTELRFLALQSVEIEKGEVWLGVKAPLFLVRTPDGAVEIKSGEVDVATGEKGTRVIVCKGSAAITTPDGTRHEILEGREFRFRFGGEPVDVEAATGWTKEIKEPAPAKPGSKPSEQ